ncbi:ATP-binding protein [Desulfobacterales bacterium HSG2]|nr:ATP-binding protein [Desulfobacterales bacterium HSG2]
MKIGLMLIIVTTLILSGFGVWQYRHLKSERTAWLTDLSNQVTERLADNLPLPMWDMHETGVEKVIRSEMRDRNIAAIIVRDHKERIYVGMQRGDRWQIIPVIKEISGDFITNDEDIIEQDVRLGDVTIHITPRFVREELRKGVRGIVITVVILDIVLFLVLSFGLRKMIVRPVSQILETASAISMGDFTHEVKVHQQDEIGKLADAFRQMQESIARVLGEVRGLTSAIGEGQLKQRGDSESFCGGWRELIEGTNNVIDAFITPFELTSEYIEKISKGIIPERIEGQSRGDFRKIENNLNILIDSTNSVTQIAEDIAAGNIAADVRERSENDRLMQALNRMIQKIREIMNETETMIQAVGRDELDIRGNAQAFEGGWRELVVGINDLINGLSHAISTAAEVSMELELAKKMHAVQERLIQSEKLAALGNLIAGVSHEINTPIGAIRASAGNITDSLHKILDQFPLVFQILSKDRQKDFFALIKKSSESEAVLSSREERRLRRTLTGKLEEQGVEDAYTVADTFTDMGIYDNTESFLPLLRHPESGSVLETAYNISSLMKNARNIAVATDRASKVTFALKSYAHFDRDGEMILSELSGGIETVLTLYHNQLKQGIEVIRNYEKFPPVPCYPDELNQVWTNIIHNAIQAMDNQGKLEIDVRQKKGDAVVTVTDTGKGIPEDIREKIFDPFFTTKPAGEGSGLGLHIVKKIIDKHNGKIRVESEPGRTAFSFFIPVSPNVGK